MVFITFATTKHLNSKPYLWGGREFWVDMMMMLRNPKLTKN